MNTRSFFASMSLLLTSIACSSLPGAALSAIHSETTSNESAAAVELTTFVRDWFSGFDRHAPADFFLERLTTPDFRIAFPDATLRNEPDFRAWHASVDGFQDVLHELREITVVDATSNRAELAIRVDWSARNGSEDLFFAAAQTWTLVRIGQDWKIETYDVRAATSASWINLKPITSGDMTAQVDYQVKRSVPAGDVWGDATPLGPVSYRIEAAPLWVNIHRVGLTSGDKVFVQIIAYGESCYRGSCVATQDIVSQDLDFSEEGRFSGQLSDLTLDYQLNDGYALTRKKSVRHELVVWINGELYKDPHTGNNLQIDMQAEDR